MSNDPEDSETERASYGRASEIPLSQWRDVFARVLATYFTIALDYRQGRPRPFDPERLYELNSDWLRVDIRGTLLPGAIDLRSDSMVRG